MSQKDVQQTQTEQEKKHRLNGGGVNVKKKERKYCDKVDVN